MKHSEIFKINETEWKALPSKDLRKIATTYFSSNFTGTTVINKDKLIKIRFVNSGAQKAIYGRKAGYEKLVVIKKLKHILEHATFSSWQKPRGTHKHAIGFMRFIAYVYINDRKRRYTFDIRVDNNGNFFYDLNVYVKGI